MMPGEIEATILLAADIRKAVVIPVADGAGGAVTGLTAFFETTTPPVQSGLAESNLRIALSHKLPRFLMPTRFVHMSQGLPLTANGKVDRRALLAAARATSKQSAAPLSGIDPALADLWTELLGQPIVTADADFFLLGGHSLLAVSLIERMRQVGLSADVRVLFNQPTLAALAAAEGSGREVEVPANRIAPDCTYITPDLLPLVELDQAMIERIVATVPGGAANVQDIYPLAPLQEGILYHHLSAGQGDPYLLQSRLAFDSLERVQAFAAALRQVMTRHDILRTGVVWEGLDSPVQVVWRDAQLSVQAVALDPADGDVIAQLHGRQGAGQIGRQITTNLSITPRPSRRETIH